MYQSEHSEATFSVQRGILIKLKWNVEVIRVIYEYYGDEPDYSDEFCDHMCDCCCIHVSDFDELKEHFIVQEDIDDVVEEHVLGDFDWRPRDIVYTGSELNWYIFKNIDIYKEILKDVEKMKNIALIKNKTNLVVSYI